MTIAILIKLLETRIVANNFFGRSSNFAIISNFLEPVSSCVSRSDRVSENSATSAPDIKAEHNNKIKSKIMPSIKVTLSDAIKMAKLAGSESNGYRIC